MRKIVTLDIGGTNIKIGIFEDEVLVQEAEMPTRAKQGAKDVIDRCIAFIKQYMPCDGIGISTCLSTMQMKTCQVTQACK